VVSDWPYFGDVVPALVVVAFCVQDWRSTGRVHPLYRWGLPLFVGMEALTDYLYAQHPAWWVATARWMIGA
jgi:hypothetical protein